MRVIDAILALQPGKKPERKAAPLCSPWGEKAAAASPGLPRDTGAGNCPLPEYPRPQMAREDWVNLNGWWDYAIAPAGQGYPGPQGKILVPFSPETALSGVGRVLRPGECLWYEKDIGPVSLREGRRLILHFGAVDERCAVWWNGKLLGKHRNGYLSFEFDVTDRVRPDRNRLLVCVRDDTDRGTACCGKQRLHPGGMYYQCQSGIWQTVWLENVPALHIRDLKIVPRPEKREVLLEIGISDPERIVGGRDLSVCIESEGRKIPYVRGEGEGKYEAVEGGRIRLTFPVVSLRLWTPERPELYPAVITLGEDRVETYFAMRSFGTGVDAKGHPCLTLNGKPYFFNGVLDQGYWPESLMTAPSDEAMAEDILAVKRLGFNMLRKHEKTEPARWYWHCDRLGMAVWQDMVHGGGPVRELFTKYLPNIWPPVCRMISDRHYGIFSRKDPGARKRFEEDLILMMRQLGNAPCIGLWVLFNEGWGQFDSLRLTGLMKKEDPTRPVDHASGWYDQGGGDIRSDHNYFRKLAVEKDSRPYVLSEYGGYSCRVPGHTMFPGNYGYHASSPEKFRADFAKIRHSIEALRERGLSAAVYTQLSDVEEETNGLLTYDRKVCKL